VSTFWKRQRPKPERSLGVPLLDQSVAAIAPRQPGHDSVRGQLNRSLIVFVLVAAIPPSTLVKT